jgi:hypothetical protein
MTSGSSGPDVDSIDDFWGAWVPDAQASVATDLIIERFEPLDPERWAAEGRFVLFRVSPIHDAWWRA